MSNRWQQVEQIYHSTLEREESQRAAYLQEVCAGDAALLEEVQSILAQDNRTGQFWERPAMEVTARLLAENQSEYSFLVGQLGVYQIVSLLGAGGMGEVYQAHDTKLDRSASKCVGVTWASVKEFFTCNFTCKNSVLAVLPRT